MVGDDGSSFAPTGSLTSSNQAVQHEEASTASKRSIPPRNGPPDPQAPLQPSWSMHQLHRHKTDRSSDSMHLDLPQAPAAAQTALAALQFLPTPLIVLDSFKTVVLANEAMGRLLGLFDVRTDVPKETIIEGLRGQSLSQIGIDMISDGVPIWVSWDKFLDNLASGLAGEPPLVSPSSDGRHSGDITPVADLASRQHVAPAGRSRSPTRGRAPIQDTAVEVVISSSHLHSTTSPHHRANRHHKPRSLTCRMIITIWTLDEQRFFTLTFTASGTQHAQHRHSNSAHLQARATSASSGKSAHPGHSPVTPVSSTSSSVVTSPSENSAHATAFPPNGAPAKCSLVNTFTEFQKVTRMKDAMLDAMHIPVIAMWRDESVVFPNQAARKLLAVRANPTTEDSYDFMSRFNPWTADFSRELKDDENPIIKLCRTQQPFARWQIGLVNPATGKRFIYDVSGYPVFDDRTNEFYAGLVAFKDVTEYTEKIANQTAENEQQFQLICDTMPQLLWTTRPDGFHDYFSQRWYDYTGLKPEECRGLNWVLPFHPDDLAVAGKKWEHSLATGEEYLVEYRCRRNDGVWRWMLGRALPLKDRNGKIIKWFGTCTDIQDIVDAREVSRRGRQQLVDVLNHAQMWMWIIDRDGILTFFEGPSGDKHAPGDVKLDAIGKPAAEAFKDQLDPQKFSLLVNKVLSGQTPFEMLEVRDKQGRWFRMRLMPQRGHSVPSGPLDHDEIVGVVGTSMEVTSMKEKEQENVRLIAKETAAKEASKMKSSFLANMSHEIRTPIAGVLGMSELLMDTELDQEQSEFAQNIQRSANSLLTVINDILDFSKIESGRLDIEEVQFSLSIVLKDVAKMLSYAATRKNLQFTSEIHLGDVQELPLLGDPGRIRQILTNLLTNSIKFTTEGYVKLRASIVEATSDTITVEFTVQDTGIGIEEEVKKRLFKPFSQADSSTARRFGGTGLGLTISKNLVDLMRGQIWLDSRLGEGTTATFRIPFKKPEFANGTHTQLVEIGALPDRLQSELSLSIEDSRPDAKGRRSTPPLPQSPHSAASARATKGGSISPDIPRDKFHILVVEDNNVNQQIALKFIRGLRFSVNAVWNGKEALQYLLKATDSRLSLEERAHFPVPSVILMDCQMPVLDGYHATHILRHHAPYSQIEAINRIPIVAMTASAIQGDRERCERAGMDDYLAKPVRRPVLEKMILKWIARAAMPDDPPSQYKVAKPTLSRSGTDHSSNCADFDSIAYEILGDTAGAPTPGALGPNRPGLSPVLPTQSMPTRTGLKDEILANQIIGANTEAERSAIRVADQEKAAWLRDEKLLAATDVESQAPAPFPQSPLSETTDNQFSAPPTSPLPKSYPTQGNSESAAGVMALTEENVEKFNKTTGSPGGTLANPAGEEDYFTQQLPNGDVPEHPKIVVPVTDIPGPPPDFASPAGGVRVMHVKDLPPGTVAGAPSNSESSGSPTFKRMQSQALSITRPTMTLALKARSASDWSSSNATLRQEPKSGHRDPMMRKDSSESQKSSR